MATNINVSATRIMSEYESASQNIRVSSTRIMTEYEYTQCALWVSSARIMVEYTDEANNLQAGITLEALTLSATITNAAPTPPTPESDKKDFVQLRWLGMQM